MKCLPIFHTELLKNSSNKDYNIIETNIKKLPYRALLAINSLISLDFKNPNENVRDNSFQRKEIKPICLNVFPQGKQTYILLSYFSEDRHEYEEILSWIDSYNISDLEMFYSKIILLQCLNFFVSPIKWILIPKEIKKNIVSNLINNMFNSVRPKIHDYFSNHDFGLKPIVNIFQLLKES